MAEQARQSKRRDRSSGKCESGRVKDKKRRKEPKGMGDGASETGPGGSDR